MDVFLLTIGRRYGMRDGADPLDWLVATEVEPGEPSELSAARWLAQFMRWMGGFPTSELFAAASEIPDQIVVSPDTMRSWLSDGAVKAAIHPASALWAYVMFGAGLASYPPYEGYEPPQDFPLHEALKSLALGNPSDALPRIAAILSPSDDVPRAVTDSLATIAKYFPIMTQVPLYLSVGETLPALQPSIHDPLVAVFEAFSALGSVPPYSLVPVYRHWSQGLAGWAARRYDLVLETYAPLPEPLHPALRFVRAACHLAQDELDAALASAPTASDDWNIDSSPLMVRTEVKRLVDSREFITLGADLIRAEVFRRQRKPYTALEMLAGVDFLAWASSAELVRALAYADLYQGELANAALSAAAQIDSADANLPFARWYIGSKFGGVSLPSGGTPGFGVAPILLSTGPIIINNNYGNQVFSQSMDPEIQFEFIKAVSIIEEKIVAQAVQSSESAQLAADVESLKAQLNSPRPNRPLINLAVQAIVSIGRQVIVSGLTVALQPEAVAAIASLQHLALRML